MMRDRGLMPRSLGGARPLVPDRCRSAA